MVRACRLSFLGLLICSGPGPAPVAAQSTVTGIVVEISTRRPISDVLIELDTARQVTSADGRFRFTDVRAGSRTLRTSHIAYVARIDTINVREGDVVELQVAIAAEPIALDPLVVDVRSMRLLDAGFYERAARGNGVFIHPEQLRRATSPHLSDFLARIPGVRRAMVNGESSRIDLRGGRSLSMPCQTQYFLDGAAVANGTAVLDNLVPINVAGIEVYRGASETPMQFDYGRASCGAIVIWTRHN